MGWSLQDVQSLDNDYFVALLRLIREGKIKVAVL